MNVNLIEAQTKIETESLEVFECFQNNYLKVNSTRPHVMLTTDNIVQVNVGGNIISNEKTVKLLGITVENKLSFEPHLNKICKKLTKSSMSLQEFQKKKLMRALITSQFSYCPLV